MPALWVTILTAALLLLGLIGTVIPALPGIGFIFLGVLIYAAATNFTVITPITVIAFGIVSFFAWLTDLLGSTWGARAGGGRKNALIGSLVGAIGGLFVLGPPGLLLGAFLGSFFGAITSGDSDEKALRIAIYSVIGVLGGAVMQFVLGAILILAFIIALFV